MEVVSRWGEEARCQLWITEVPSRTVQQSFNVVSDLVAAIEAPKFICTSLSKKVA